MTDLNQCPHGDRLASLFLRDAPCGFSPGPLPVVGPGFAGLSLPPALFPRLLSSYVSNVLGTLLRPQCPLRGALRHLVQEP